MRPWLAIHNLDISKYSSAVRGELMRQCACKTCELSLIMYPTDHDIKTTSNERIERHKFELVPDRNSQLTDFPTGTTARRIVGTRSRSSSGGIQQVIEG